MILFYEGLNLHRVKAGPGGIFSFAFSPGKNEVPDDAWAAFIDPEKGSIGVKVMLEEEKLWIAKVLRSGREVPVKTEADLDTSQMPYRDAVAVIGNIFDSAGLERHLSQEKGREAGPRKSVREAIDKQMRAVNAKAPSQDEEPDEIPQATPVEDDPKPQEPIAKIHHMTVISMVGKSETVEALEAIENGEKADGTPRASVLEAINERLAELAKGEDPQGEGDPKQGSDGEPTLPLDDPAREAKAESQAG